MTKHEEATSDQEVAEIVANLMDKVAELSERNGELKAKNLTLKEKVDEQKKEIQELKAGVSSLQEMQQHLIEAATKLGINLKPVLNQAGPDAVWGSRGLELAGAYLKARVSKLSIPDFHAAKSTEELQAFLSQLPGFNSEGDEQTMKDQYGYTQVNAEQFILREKH